MHATTCGEAASRSVWKNLRKQLTKPAVICFPSGYTYPLVMRTLKQHSPWLLMELTSEDTSPFRDFCHGSHLLSVRIFRGMQRSTGMRGTGTVQLLRSP